MVIEWLKVTVEKDEIDRYIQLDQAIWTPVLAACDGFHKKEVWWSPDGEIDGGVVEHPRTVEIDSGGDFGRNRSGLY